MRRRIIRVPVSVALGCFGLVGFASPASASCSEPVDGTGCIENIVCEPVGKIAECVE